MTDQRILLCVDNSPLSDAATDQAGAMARLLGARVVAVHAYAARLHDRRFRDLEPGLPGGYREPERLEESRRTHDSLIGRGLELISDSFLAATRERLPGLPLETRSVEGKNYVELVREAGQGYDLAVIGARGLGLGAMNGQCPPGALGSVCERFLRRARTDVLVVRDARKLGQRVVVCIDGSPESFGALTRGLRIAEAHGGEAVAVACYDPHYHPVAFQSIAGVLSEKDARMFRFKEQEELHDRIINHGLENLYQSHLDNARAMAQGRRVDLATVLLEGKPGFRIPAWLAEGGPTLLVVGRFGMHRTEDLDLGHTAETLVRHAPCSVLVVDAPVTQGGLRWTAEAEARIAGIPDFMRAIVRRAVESHARARGLTEVTSEVVTAAKTGHGVRMPGHAPDAGGGDG